MHFCPKLFFFLFFLLRFPVFKISTRIDPPPFVLCITFLSITPYSTFAKWAFTPHIDWLVHILTSVPQSQPHLNPISFLFSKSTLVAHLLYTIRTKYQHPDLCNSYIRTYRYFFFLFLTSLFLFVSAGSHLSCTKKRKKNFDSTTTKRLFR